MDALQQELADAQQHFEAAKQAAAAAAAKAKEEATACVDNLLQK